MKALITGTSQGIGKATAELFLKNNIEVVGVDLNESTIDHPNYKHYRDSIVNFREVISDLTYIVHNAGIQIGPDVISVNLEATIALDTFYRGLNPNLKAVTFNTSISGKLYLSRIT